MRPEDGEVRQVRWWGAGSSLSFHVWIIKVIVALERKAAWEGPRRNADL